MRYRLAIAHPVRALALLAFASLTACSQSKSDAPSPAPTSIADANADCMVQLSGNLKSSLTFPTCGQLSSAPSEAGVADFALNFHFATQGLASLNISIPLGASPSPGSYSSEDPATWSATGITTAKCHYTAGSQSVPVGSFKLTLSQIEIADAGSASYPDASTEGVDAGLSTADGGGEPDANTDGGNADTADAGSSDGGDADADTGPVLQPRAGVVHGKLELTMYVLAPPATDCGVGDTESVVVDF